jgi:hypothetical protein
VNLTDSKDIWNVKGLKAVLSKEGVARGWGAYQEHTHANHALSKTVAMSQFSNIQQHWSSPALLTPGDRRTE